MSAGYFNVLTSDDGDLLAVQELLGDNGGQSAKQMSFAVDDDLLYAFFDHVSISFFSIPSSSCFEGEEQRITFSKVLIIALRLPLLSDGSQTRRSRDIRVAGDGSFMTTMIGDDWLSQARISNKRPR